MINSRLLIHGYACYMHRDANSDEEGGESDPVDDKTNRLGDGVSLMRHGKLT